MASEETEMQPVDKYTITMSGEQWFRILRSIEFRQKDLERESRMLQYAKITVMDTCGWSDEDLKDEGT